MELQISEEPIATLSEHANVSIAFAYDRILDLSLIENGLGGFALSEIDSGDLQLKDYDLIDGEGPNTWATQFDVSSWGLLVARADGNRIGGAVIAFDSANVQMLEGRRDLAVLWDIRIAPDFRGQSVGSSLFRAAEQWSINRGCKQLKIETQNTNLSACKFYAKQGCKLAAINRFAYPKLKNEIQMIWYIDLL